MPHNHTLSNNLKRATEAYWENLRRNYQDPFPTQCNYVKNLLPLEMESMVAPQPCETLVLLVGHAIEPLLQAVWVYCPKTLVFILNHKYSETLSGWDFAKQLRKLLTYLPEEKQVFKNNIVECVIAQATPTHVFSEILQHVHANSHVVIDITGAKKSMVAGAFLYAAYANVPVSYVDFDDTMYNTQYGRPYGYAATIRSFANPYDTFALRDWEQVRALYQHYHFREAHRLLQERIQPVMAKLNFKPDPNQAVEYLIQALRCYELWDSGNLTVAQVKGQELQQQAIAFDPPSAVTHLASIWPNVDEQLAPQGAATTLLKQHQTLTDGNNTITDSFFCRDAWLITYAEDELARIHRLMLFNEDYRSAFLRAASLNEVLLKARLAGLWRDDLLQGPGNKSLTSFPEAMARATATKMVLLLWRKQDYHFGRDSGIALKFNASSMAAFWNSCELDLETLIALRNKVIHTYLSIPYSVAEAAWNVAQANLQDYRTNWSMTVPPVVTTQSLSWSALCRLCGADTFLPPNLLT